MNRVWTPSELRVAHGCSSGHRNQVLASKQCACFHCCKVFPPRRIEEWIDEGDVTALCPACGIDAVLGDASGLAVSDVSFLEAMRRYWF